MENDIQAKLASITHQGDKKNWTFNKYCIMNLHNQHSSLFEYGVAPLTDSTKIYHFQNGIIDKNFNICKSQVMVSPDKFETFDSSCPSVELQAVLQATCIIPGLPS